MTDGETLAAAQSQLEAQREKLAAERAKKPPPATSIGSELAGAVPDAGELRGYAKILAQITSSDPEERRRGRFAAADDTRRNLHRFKKKAIPSFPVRLPPESVLMQILKKRGKARASGDRKTIFTFVKWREAVMRAEHSNEATLRALFEAVVTFREFELPAYAVEILEHLALEFEVEQVPDERLAWNLERMTRDTATLSVNLRRGSYEKRPPKVEHSEDDDTALRGGSIPTPGSAPGDDVLGAGGDFD